MKRAHLPLLAALPPLLLLLASGCTLAPRYVRPGSSAPAEWPAAAAVDTVAEAGLPAAAELAPDDFFPDARLRRVLALARANNLDLRLAALNVEKVRAVFKIQRADLLPAIGATASASRVHRPGGLYQFQPEYTNETYEVDVGVSAWEVDLFGRVRSEKNQAFEQYLASEEGRRGAELSLVTAVGQAWLSLAATRDLRALADSVLEAQQDIHDMMSVMYDAGLATKLDLKRSEMQLHSSELDAARYQRQEAEDRDLLDLLAGVPVPDELLPDGLDGVVPPRAVAAGLSSDVLLGRPDVMAAEHRLKAANAYLGVARAAFFPRISLTALLGTASAALSGLFDAGSKTWTFAGQATTPLFDLRTRGALQASEADRAIVLTQYQQAIQTAFRETADALAARATLSKQLASQQALADAAGEAYELARDRYAKGVDSYLGVLDAQRSYDAALQGLTGMRLAELANRIRLYAVLGGGPVGGAEGAAE